MAASTTTLSAVVNSIAQERGEESTKVGKRVRAHIRRNFDSIVANDWPALAEAKANRDGNRYPPMPRAFGDALVKRFGNVNID